MNIKDITVAKVEELISNMDNYVRSRGEKVVDVYDVEIGLDGEILMTLDIVTDESSYNTDMFIENGTIDFY